MIKYYCDCCGQEIKGEYPTQWTLDERDFAESTWTDIVPYRDAMLCEDCYENRLSKLVEVDKRLFDKTEENKVSVVVMTSSDNRFPTISVFNNKEAAKCCREHFSKVNLYDNLFIYECPIYSKFKDGEATNDC